MRFASCIAGGLFLPADGAIVGRLRLRGHVAATPAGVSPGNGRRLFHNMARLECTREVVEAAPPLCAVHAACDDVCPLNANGERFPARFAREVFERFGRNGAAARSRYWATVDEAELIFDSPFATSFLREKNAVVLCLDGAASRARYYNVCGTRRPEVFNADTCRRYHPVNFCGRPYSPGIATHMKASAIRHGCMSSRVWLTTRRAARSGVAVRAGARPLTFFFDDVFHLVNVAMTLDPARLMECSMSRNPSDMSDDDVLTVP